MSTHDHPRNDLALAEAALFLAPQPLTRRALAKILGGVAQAYVDQLLEDLKAQFEDDHRGIELHIEDGRAMFRVKNAYVNEVAHLAPQHDIPRQELRTLAVIAYNHPMTQSNLIKVRGNKGYKHVQELLERRLITSEPHGRTLLLRVTQEFLRHFGLSSVEEFRFHFPSAAEENAEALARAANPVSGESAVHDEDQDGESPITPSEDTANDTELNDLDSREAASSPSEEEQLVLPDETDGEMPTVIPSEDEVTSESRADEAPRLDSDDTDTDSEDQPDTEASEEEEEDNG